MDIYIKKADKVVDVDWNAFNDDVKNHIIEYGLKQKLNDAHSHIKASDDKAAELAITEVDRVLSNLYAGNIRPTARRQGQTQYSKIWNRLLLKMMSVIQVNGQPLNTQKKAQAVLEKLDEKNADTPDYCATAEIVDLLAQAKNVEPDTLLQELDDAVQQELNAHQELPAIKIEI